MILRIHLLLSFGLTSHEKKKKQTEHPLLLDNKGYNLNTHKYEWSDKLSKQSYYTLPEKRQVPL